MDKDIISLDTNYVVKLVTIFSPRGLKLTVDLKLYLCFPFNTIQGHYK
jgi:hypothetical protein